MYLITIEMRLNSTKSLKSVMKMCPVTAKVSGHGD